MFPRLVPKGLLVAGPPCSLYVGACISVHQRTVENPEGNTANFKVRLSNRIWRNFVSWNSFWDILRFIMSPIDVLSPDLQFSLLFHCIPLSLFLNTRGFPIRALGIDILFLYLMPCNFIEILWGIGLWMFSDVFWVCIFGIGMFRYV